MIMNKVYHISQGQWRARLEDAIAASGKSMRSICIEARLGNSYLHGVLRGGKDPTIDRLLAVCEAIPADPMHVILGLDAAPGDLKILRALHANPVRREAILALLSEEIRSQSTQERAL